MFNTYKNIGLAIFYLFGIALLIPFIGLLAVIVLGRELCGLDRNI